MPIYITNTLTRKKEEFKPLQAPQVNIYTCGVTVYDDCHIGHARSLVIFDIIRRYLSYRGYQVRFVRNITDIDDKIINRARELKEDWHDLVRTYISRYYEDCDFLGIARGDFEPRASENIPYMHEYIVRLIEKGHAYESGGDVYFSVRSFKGYGKLSGQSIEQMMEGVRIEPNSLKKDPLDFALWKRSKPDEPSWKSPWGEGRPGWHIECSVMSQRLLNVETLDIHAGGRDLVFPHHENEIAQSEALTQRPFARYWMHHGLLTINGQKMSKSLGNFITISDFKKKYHTADLLKLFFLGTHYAHPVDYTQDRIEEARQALERLIIARDKAGQPAAVRRVQSEDAGPKVEEIEALRSSFIEAMDDDFNTPKALAVMFDLVTRIHKRLEDKGFAAQAEKAFREMLGVLGLSLSSGAAAQQVSETEIAGMIEAREVARLNKDFKQADKIRNELLKKGVILEDGKEGTGWRWKV